MSGLDFDDIHGDIAPALAEMSRLLRIVPLSSSPVGGFTPPTHGLPAGDGDLSEVIA